MAFDCPVVVSSRTTPPSSCRSTTTWRPSVTGVEVANELRKLQATTREFSRALRRELDFSCERRNMEQFTRKFAEYRARAARGESIRVTSPDGDFVFEREPRGITGDALLKRLEKLPGAGIFDDGGADAITAGRSSAKPAQSPWD